MSPNRKTLQSGVNRNKRVTLQTIADELGVSRATVSNAYIRPNHVSQSLRERILSCAASLGYAGPNPNARALRSGSTGAIGVVVTESLDYIFHDPGIHEFLYGFSSFLAQSSYSLLVIPCGQLDDGTFDATRVEQALVDGLIVYSTPKTSGVIDAIRARNIPLVTVDDPVLPKVPYVGIDDFDAAVQCARMIIDAGHRHVGAITWFPTPERNTPRLFTHKATSVPFGVSQTRLKGWCAAFTEADLPAPHIVIASRNDRDASKDATQLLLSHDPNITAVLAIGDVIASGIYHYAEQYGLRIPNDLSVVGFDDLALAQHLDPPLTTVRQSLQEKGRLAATLLLAQLEKRDAPARKLRHILPYELVVRKSVARIANA